MNVFTADTNERILAGVNEERFLTLFFVLYKTSRLVDTINDTFKKQLESFYNQYVTICEDYDEASIKIISGRFFVNELMVRFDKKGLTGAEAFIKEWETLGIGGVHFAGMLPKESIERFFSFTSDIKPGKDNIDILTERLQSCQLEDIQFLSKAAELDDNQMTEEIRRGFRKVARKTFYKAISVVEEAVAQSKDDDDINTSKTKRVIHSLIDQIMRDESSMLELTAIKNFDDYTYAHSVNVSVYSLTMGVKLGLDRPRLSQLGFASLFHDIGKVKLPADLIRKPDAFDEDDWIQMQLHPLLGAKSILRNLPFDVHSARAARSAFEHHINRDFTGYPMLRLKKRTQNLFSLIISICDTFDALTSGRVYIKKKLTTDDVVKKMAYQMKVKFDNFLLKIFNDIIGIFPVGSLVLLTTDEIALILANNDDDKLRPYIKIVGDRQGLLDIPLWVDLTQDDQFNRKIVRKIEPERYGLNVNDFILED